MKKQLLFWTFAMAFSSFNATAQVPCNTTADCPSGTYCCESDSNQSQGICEASCMESNDRSGVNQKNILDH